MKQMKLAARSVTYQSVGATRSADAEWTPPAGFRAFEQTARIGHGQAHWEAASSAVLAWGVKTRSGFHVEPPMVSGRVLVGDDAWLIARLGPVRVREPVRVVAVVDRPDRCGFAYGTLDGHPVTGEEAFIVHRSSDGAVWLTLRSLTQPGRRAWRLGFPAVLLAQRWYRWRYLRALADTQASR
jgi:uncharacterized protein (UPF0548 family)